VWSDNTNNNNRINLHNIRIIMADKKQKNTELRMRIPDGHREILEEYCRVFGTTPSSTICGYIVEDLWQALARTRVNYEKLHFSNIYSRASTKCGKQSSEPKKKKGTQIPDDFDPPREIAEEHELNHEKAVSYFIDWAKGKGHVQANWISTYRNACRTWIKEKMPQSSEPKLKFD
jgi:hypothetical protein